MTRWLLALAALCWVALAQADPPLKLSFELVEWSDKGGPFIKPPPGTRPIRSLTVGAFRGREFAAATGSPNGALEVEGKVLRTDGSTCRLRVTVRTFRRTASTGADLSLMTGHEELEFKLGEPLLLSYCGGGKQTRALLLTVSK